MSIVVLSFFLWTFGGVFDIAYAIKSDQQSAVSNQQISTGYPVVSSQPKTQKPEEKFQKAIDDIEQALSDTSTDTDTKKNRVKGKKGAIDALDVEIRKQFTDTEKKLKDAGLPFEILERHHKFVRHYEDNLKELKGNLDDIDRAKTKGETDAAIGRAKAHLEKVKPPKKHKPLDPNKLPHRTAEPVFIEPRTSPEEFPKESQQSKVAGLKSQAILVASNGPLNGLLNSPSSNPESSVPVLLAQVTNPPTSVDLAETIEVQFTPEIQAKAEELQYNPVKIYEYVRNSFEYEPYYGSLKGAQQTLLEKAGNDFDQASLLIALLRASNIPARYVYGTVEIPIEKLMNWVGGVTEPNTAATIIATAGVPGKLLTEGGKIKYAQMEHAWVEAYVPYGNYRGAIRDDSIKTWIPLDPSFKQYEYKRGMDLYAALGINGEQYTMDYITDTSPSPIPAELQDLFPNYTISPYQFYSKRLLNYIDTNSPDSTIEDIIGDETIELTKTIIKKEYPYLLGSLPYKVIVKGATYPSTPDNLRHRISFSLENPLAFETILSYSITLPEIAGKRITLSYVPAASVDESLVTQYGGLLKVPPYLLNVKPVIKANGTIVATGSPVGLGYEQTFNMSFRLPNKGTDVVTNKITAGDYSAIAIQYYKTSSDVVADKMQTLQDNRTSTDLDDLLGQMLYNIGISYAHHLTFEEELYAKNFQMFITREPSSEGIVTSHAVTEWLWGMPYKVTEGGIGIDVDRNVYVPFPIDGDLQRKKDFMIVSGLGSSAWEDMILQSFFNIPSVSASRLLKMANQQGIPIFTIDSSNINSQLPQLQVSSEVKDDVRNSVNAGEKVIIPKTNIQYNDWNGVGYIILDPIKGTGAYMISGGLAGGHMSTHPDASIRAKSDWSAYVTSLTRQYIVEFGLAHLDTPYIWGGEDPDCGFDCSGFVQYIYKSAYGENIFGGIDRGAASIYDYLKRKGDTLPYSERLKGDIVWRSNFKHIGIYYLKTPDDSIYKGADLIVHASGRDCENQQDQNGWLPPPQCIVVEEKKLICGHYQRVVITTTKEFGPTMAAEIGRPVP